MKDKEYKHNRQITAKNKIKLLKALEQTYGIASSGCKLANLSLNTFYYWFNHDEEFREAVILIRETNLDMCEEVIYDAAKKRDVDTAKWVMKHKGKDRGYSEKTIQDVNITSNIVKFKFGNDTEIKDEKE